MFEGIELPKVYLVRQKFNDFAIGDIASAVRSELEKSGILSRLRGGMRVALTAGSRGIDRIDQVIKAVVETIKLKGCKPFVLPQWVLTVVGR
jgi:ribosomal protein S19E (S16A)